MNNAKRQIYGRRGAPARDRRDIMDAFYGSGKKITADLLSCVEIDRGGGFVFCFTASWDVKSNGQEEY